MRIMTVSFLYNIIMKFNRKMRLKNQNYKLFKKEDLILAIIVLVIIVSYILLKIFTIKSEKILLNYAENKSKELSLMLINNAIEKNIVSSKLDDIIIIEKNESNEIISVDFDNQKIHTITTQINNNIQKNLLKLENDKDNEIISQYYNNNKKIIYDVPMSVIYDVPVLTGLGPRIPFKLDVLGNINSNMITNIKDYGINNSLIEISIEVNTEIQIILPFSSKNIVTKNTIPLKTKIIQGKIPTYYGNTITSKSK